MNKETLKEKLEWLEGFAMGLQAECSGLLAKLNHKDLDEEYMTNFVMAYDGILYDLERAKSYMEE